MYFSPLLAEIAFWATKTSSVLACSAAGLLATRPAAAVAARVWASGTAFGVAGWAWAVVVVHIAAISAPLAAKTSGRLSCIEGSPPGRANRPGGRPGRERGRWGKMVRLSGNQDPVPKAREQATNVR